MLNTKSIKKSNDSYKPLNNIEENILISNIINIEERKSTIIIQHEEKIQHIEEEKIQYDK